MVEEDGAAEEIEISRDQIVVVKKEVADFVRDDLELPLRTRTEPLVDVEDPFLEIEFTSTATKEGSADLRDFDLVLPV